MLKMMTISGILPHSNSDCTALQKALEHWRYSKDKCIMRDRVETQSLQEPSLGERPAATWAKVKHTHQLGYPKGQESEHREWERPRAGGHGLVLRHLGLTPVLRNTMLHLMTYTYV